MGWTIQELVRATGVTSRTLRHYDAIGLLEPARRGPNGLREYDEEGLVRLQRILVLRELGLGLEAIGGVLADRVGPVEALTGHRDALVRERERLGRLIDALEDTIARLEGGEPLMAEQMFDGFDHARYRDEVVERWGERAYADGDRWWRALPAQERAQFHRASARLGEDWARAAAAGEPADGPVAGRLAERHVAWVTGVPGTPAAGGDAGRTREYVLGLGELYVADPRFAAAYGGQAGARFVRDALRAHYGA